MNDSVTFRSVTPLFRFEMEDGQVFHYSGVINGATFEVTLKKIPPGLEGFTELMRYADEGVKTSLTSIHMAPEGLFPAAEYFVVVDLTYSPATGLEKHGGTPESALINRVILESLRVNASKGIDRFNTYHWREPQNIGHGISSPLLRPSLFSLLGSGSSVLPASKFEKCRAVADNLMVGWDDTIGFDRVLQMAMSYHEVACTFLEPKHGFLLLMIIFEAMFKGRAETTQIAIRRLSRLLASDVNERKLIASRFGTGKSSYTKIRDSIAHGDVSLESEAVKQSYPKLYNYVTAAITQLLLMRNGVFDPKHDFYEEMSRVSEDRYTKAIENT